MKLPWFLLTGATLMAAQSSSFDSLVDRYFDAVFRQTPTFATAVGFHHPYDGQLEDYSKHGFQQRIELAHQYLPEFQKLPQSDDRDLVISHIQADLVNLENIHGQTKDPDMYVSGPTASTFPLISRKFPPAEERLRAVISRERQIPQVLLEGRKSLDNPPKIYT